MKASLSKSMRMSVVLSAACVMILGLTLVSVAQPGLGDWYSYDCYETLYFGDDYKYCGWCTWDEGVYKKCAESPVTTCYSWSPPGTKAVCWQRLIYCNGPMTTFNEDLDCESNQNIVQTFAQCTGGGLANTTVEAVMQYFPGVPGCE